ncbi:MAG: methyltransferase domain-containing protein [Actinobacteria bacterium]|nr:methyltransferase domain-containing protein [Actinomycetota bacterium]
MGRILDSNYRRRIQKPANIIKWSGVKEGMYILEVGCGSGAFTTFFARATGKSGRIFALDIQKNMLVQLERKLRKSENRDIGNIEIVHSDAHNMPFKDNFFDLAYMISVFQEIPDKVKTLSEIIRVLKTGGLLSISEFITDPDFPFRKTTIKQSCSGGFKLDGIFGKPWNYTIRFRNGGNN